MQKKLIAMAVAGLVSGAAFAQSNVTIYGVMDTTWENIKVSDGIDMKSHKRLATNSSYIGFKGAESLGNGLTAVFQFENGINSDVGGWGASRDTMVALAGGFGTIAAGNLTGPVRAIGAAVDFNPGAAGSGFTGSMYGQVGGVQTGVDNRSPNAIAYISPTFGGMYGVIAYQNGTTTSDAGTSDQTKKSKLWTLGLVYANGPLFAGFGYIKATNPGVAGAVVASSLLDDSFDDDAVTGTYATINGLLPGVGTAIAAADDSLKNYRLAAKYSFSTGTTVSGLYDSQKYTISDVTNAKRASWMFGVNQNFGASNVWLQYAKNKQLKGDICDVMTAVGQDCDDTGAKQWTLGYSYSLSKRTMLHAFYTKLSNDSNANYALYNNGVAPGKDGDTKVYSFGMRHTF